MRTGDVAPDEARAIVLAGYALASRAYRGDDFSIAGSSYAHWLGRLGALVPEGARVLDLGCGNGVPVARELKRRYEVTGVDLSPEQVARAQALVPRARFICADMTTVELPAAHFGGIVAFWSIINVPLPEQPALFARIAGWLAPGGVLLAILGRDPWTGVEENWRGVAGARMYYAQAGVAQYRTWLADAGLELIEEGREPRLGNPGYAVLIAQRGAAGGM